MPGLGEPLWDAGGFELVRPVGSQAIAEHSCPPPGMKTVGLRGRSWPIGETNLPPIVPEAGKQCMNGVSGPP